MKYKLGFPIVFSALIVTFSFTNSFARQDLKASWYSVQSLKDEGTWKTSHGKMANGKQFRDEKFTAAARWYPLGTTLRIINTENEKTVIVVVTDRISKRFATKRIDLSKSAFASIADLKQGLISIKVEVIS